MIDLSPHIEAIARRLLGVPNAKLSSKTKLRFGSHGSVAVEIAGAKAGSWFDHENNLGGGARDLITFKGGIAADDNAAVVEWLRRELGIAPGPAKAGGKAQFVATYGYRDERGELLFEVCRTGDKRFLQRKPDGRGGWVWSTKGVRAVVYRLPELIGLPVDQVVFIPEGEKDCTSLVKIGLAATTSPGGAAKRGTDGKSPRPKWRVEYNRFFRGRDVVILPDNDEAGREHAQAIAENLAPVAQRVRIVKLPGLPPKGDVSDWLTVGGTKEQLEALCAAAPAFKKQQSEPPKQKAATIIRVVAGERHKAADAGIAALVETGAAIYQRDRSLVRVCQVQARSSAGDIILVPGIAALTLAILDRALGQAADWERFDVNAHDWLTTDPPRLVVAQILDMAGEWPFFPLAGVIGCPTLRPDGSLLATEGYDMATGLVLLSAVTIPQVPDCPTRHEAEAASELLAALLDEFPFVGDVDRAVGMSMLVTPVLRGAVPVAPLHLATAPEPGTGKSYLVDLASMIATGERAAVVAVAPNAEETEKRLVGAALAGHPIIGLDNCRDTLEGDFLCQLTERPLLQLRALGKSDKIRVTNTFTVFANGNNVAVADDMVRRTVCCALDANLESPECRTFLADPLVSVRRNRGAYIAACLTVGRAYLAAGKPDRLNPLPSYEAWSDLVRSALVWLGFADPVESMVLARRADPVRQERGRIFEAWRADLGVEVEYMAPEIISRAESRHSFDGSFVHPNIAAALGEIAQKRGSVGQLEPRRLGRWLTKQENTIASGLKLTVNRNDSRRVRYRLREA